MRKHNKRILLVLVLILTMVIGYAVISTGLTINGTLATGKATFGVHLENVEEMENTAIVNTPAYLNENNNMEINFNVELKNLGDVYRFKFDIVNTGNIGVNAKRFEFDGLTSIQYDYLDIKLYNMDNMEKFDRLYYIPGESRVTILCELRYNLSYDRINVPDLETQNVNASFIIEFANGFDYNSERNVYYNSLFDMKAKSSDEIVIDYNSNSTIYEGLYLLESTKNDKYPIYFFRYDDGYGNNTMKFAGFCWKIIRTTSTGGLKLIYSGRVEDNGYCPSYLSTLKYINPDKEDAYDVDYIGSRRMTTLDSWYFINLKQFQSYLEDQPFCYTYNIEDNHFIDCEDEYSVANGKLNYPIALPSFDDLALTGGREGFIDEYNRYYFNAQKSLNGNSSALLGLSPVIYIRGGFELEGSGYRSDPYVIKE